MADNATRTSLTSMATAFTQMYRQLKDGYNDPAGQGTQNAGQPIQPREPGSDPMQYQFRTGANLTTTPREDLTAFQTLRLLADSHDITRIAIEMRKEQIRGQEWGIVPAEKDDKNDYSTDVAKAKALFAKPDGRNTMHDWLGMMLEEILVTDALTIYKRMTRGGDLFGLELIDGATIKPLLDSHGRIPMPPLAAYQQIIYGYPQTQFTTDELLYKPRNRRVYRPYGCSPVEFIMMTVNIALRKQTYLLGYFTEGNMPDGGIYQVPETWTPQQIKQYQEYWDAMMSGNMAARQKMRFVPKGGYTQTKSFLNSNEYKAEFDEWMARIVANAFGINPQAFSKQMNRATAEVQDDQQTDMGLKPLCMFIEEILTDIVQNELGMPHLRFAFISEKAADEQMIVTKNVQYVQNGIYSVDEVRASEGREPLVKGGMPPFIIIGNQPVFLTDEIIAKLSSPDNFQTPQEKQEQAMEIAGAQADARGDSEGGQNGKDGSDNPPQPPGGAKNPPKGKDKGQPDDAAKKALMTELKKWEKFALNRFGKSNARDFEPELIPHYLVKRIRYDLAQATSPDDVRLVFKSGADKMVRDNQKMVDAAREQLKKD